jgi:GNAT superfamily N-acetyltransferase
MIPSETFPLFGGKAEVLLQQAIDRGRGEYLLEDVLAQLATMEMLAFGEIRAFELRSLITARIIAYPRLRSLHIAYGAGRDVERLLPAVLEFCHGEGIARIETWCHEPVARLYRRKGFDIGYCVPVLEIKP